MSENMQLNSRELKNQGIYSEAKKSSCAGWHSEAIREGAVAAAIGRKVFALYSSNKEKRWTFNWPD